MWLEVGNPAVEKPVVIGKVSKKGMAGIHGESE
jgi:hypothetical protein